MNDIDWVTSLVVGLVLTILSSAGYVIFYIIPDLNGFALGLLIGGFGSLLMLGFVTSLIVMMLLRFRAADLQEFKASLEGWQISDVEFTQNSQHSAQDYSSPTGFDYGGHRRTEEAEEGL